MWIHTFSGFFSGALCLACFVSCHHHDHGHSFLISLLFSLVTFCACAVVTAVASWSVFASSVNFCVCFVVIDEASLLFFISARVLIGCFFGVFCSHGILTNHYPPPQCQNSDPVHRRQRVYPLTSSRAHPHASPPPLPPPPTALLPLRQHSLRSTPTTVFPAMGKPSSTTWLPWAFQGHGHPALLRNLVLMRER